MNQKNNKKYINSYTHEVITVEQNSRDGQTTNDTQILDIPLMPLKNKVYECHYDTFFDFCRYEHDHYNNSHYFDFDNGLNEYVEHSNCKSEEVIDLPFGLIPEYIDPETHNNKTLESLICNKKVETIKQDLSCNLKISENNFKNHLICDKKVNSNLTISDDPLRTETDESDESISCNLEELKSRNNNCILLKHKTNRTDQTKTSKLFFDFF